MSALGVSVRVLLSALATIVAFAAGGARAQSAGVFPYRWSDTPPGEAIQPTDIREALVWTGHLDYALKVELSEAVRQAVQSWQKAHGHPVTGKLTAEQTRDLVRDALKERETVGWSLLRDPAVGVAVGVPAQLVSFGAPRFNGAALVYTGSGAISQTVTVQLGSPNCKGMDAVYARGTQRATWRARADNWFVALFRHGDSATYLKMVCHANGMVSSEMTVPVDLLAKHPGLFSAMAGSLAMMRTPDPTVRPRPRVEDLPLAPSGFSDELAARPAARPRSTRAPALDDSGRTASLRLEMRDGPDLRADEVFEKASGAVYVVKADRRMGSAVAISESELLTNCHVVDDVTEVRLTRAKTEMPAEVVSRNVDADRCVLRTGAKLPSWVAVRPWDDIKVGEKAITIGTPQGLELSAAEGIVSSKRVFNQSRVIQTSAPISQGSSGGGLFDARGNLLGITTFYFRAGQNLNFAVAAEEYAGDRQESAAR